ncbi:MAG: YfcE family phosphodiesterase [Magnetococcales bacterium]|nr:YfcE family phosphodiesterase [Magnetococcales bacterium]
MLIGILSDSHDQIDHVDHAIEIFRLRGVEQVFHAGDIGSPSIIKQFEGLKLGAVLGNNDGERALMPVKVKQIGGEIGLDVLHADCPEGKIVVYHGTVPTFLNALIDCGAYRLVITGHTHKIVNELVGKTRVLNPGSIHGFNKGATFMIYDTALDEAEVLEI